jgi:FkbM family methyltransferase
MVPLRITDILPDIVEIPPIQGKDDPLAGSYMGDGVFMTKIWSRHLLRTSAGDMIVTPHLVNLGFIEPHNTRLLTSLIRPGDVFVDIGANIGYFSVLGAWRAWPGGQVWAFEPQPRVYPLLWDNLSINGFSGIARSHQVALSDRAGTATMRIFEGYEAASTIRDVSPDFVCATERQTGRQSRTIDVDVLRLDDVMREVPEIHVLKMDAEGHEPAIVKGGQKILARSRNVKIVMELVPPTIGRAESLAHLGLLRELGFSIFRIESDASLVHHSDDEALVDIDFSDLLLLRT